MLEISTLRKYIIIRWITPILVSIYSSILHPVAQAGELECDLLLAKINSSEIFKLTQEDSSAFKASVAFVCMSENKYDVARKLLETPELLNNPIASGMLGEIYDLRLNNPQKASNYYKKALNQTRIKCNERNSWCDDLDKLYPAVQRQSEAKLAVMYLTGRGVLQSFEEADRLAKLSASHGSVHGLIVLSGLASFKNDSIRAYMWAILASERAQGRGEFIEPAKENYEFQLKNFHLDYEEVIKAQNLAKECLMRDYKNC